MGIVGGEEREKELLCWGKKGRDLLSVSMGALDMGPAAPARRPQRAVWGKGRSWF